MSHASRSPLAVLAVAALVASCGSPPREPVEAAALPESTRRTSGGAVVGSAGRYGGHVWRGIPFARPPVGALRWRAPQPPEPWEGVREALAFGSSCVQFASALSPDPQAKPDTPSGSEDCLCLNVFAPAFGPEAVPRGADRLPVLFWIHGGGNSIGDARAYDGSRLAAEHGAVVVTTHYRLGPFGWFRHPALAGDGDADDRSGNYGILDLVRGLEWVRDEIAQFGGDPGNVTLFGESAGGANVAMLLLSPRAAGLFHRAIVQSGGAQTVDIAEAEGYADDPSPGHRHSSREIVLDLTRDEHPALDRAAARARLEATPSGELASWLRGLPATTILEAYGDQKQAGMIDLPRLIRDGAVLPEGEALARFGARGGWNAVPTVLGTNRDEVKLFLSFAPAYVRRWAILPYLRDRARYERDARYSSEGWKASGADELADAMSGSGASAFVYRFDWDEEPRILWSDFSVILGAAHGLEISFVFGHFQLGRFARVLFTDDNEPGRLALGEQMRRYWLAFARSGDPDRGVGGDLPDWQAWRDAPDGAGQFLVLDTAADGGLRMSRETVRTPALVERIVADASFESGEERCRMLAQLASRSATWREADYAALPACQGLPYAEQLAASRR
jgi:para-nitrobenzyl esterase